MKVKAIWEIDIDVKGLDPEFVDIEGHATDLAKIELDHVLKNGDLCSDDFKFETAKRTIADQGDWRIWYRQNNEHGELIGLGVYYKGYKREGYAKRVAKHRYSKKGFSWIVSKDNPWHGLASKVR